MIETQQLVFAFFSALFGASLGGAVSWGNAHRERRIKLTLDLFAQFNSPDFNHIRILAYEALTHAESMPAAYARLKGEERDAVSSVVHYWERVSILMRTGALDNGLTRRFLGQYARSWSEVLCDKEAGLVDPEWGQTLRDVKWLFARLTRTSRLGSRT